MVLVLAPNGRRRAQSGEGILCARGKARRERCERSPALLDLGLKSAVHRSPRRRRRAAGQAGTRRRRQAQRFDLATDRVDLGLGLRQIGGFDDLVERERLHAELSVGKRLQPFGTSQNRVFGAQHIDCIPLALDRVARLDDLFRPKNGLVLDRVDIDRRSDEGGDCDDMHDAPHQCLLAVRCEASAKAMSASSAPRGGASVRAPKRNLAERARGLASISLSFGVIGWPPGTAKVGAGAGASPGRRRPAASPRPERRAKNCLTMRSSSEWNVTTTRRPPGLRIASAATSPRANSPSSSLTAMRKAWKLRVAGWMGSPGRAGATRSINEASWRVETRGAAWRSVTIARAMRRAARSSPK